MAYLGNQPVVGDSANSFKTLDDIASFTVTFDATSSDVVSIANDTLTFNNHRFVTGQKVTYNDGGGTAIGGLADGSYFIIKVDQNTIKLASNASNAASATAINLTSGAAGGSHTLNVKFDGVNTKFKATHSNGKKASISRAAQLSLSINGVIQQPQDTSTPTVGYGIEADSTIVFSTAPEATDQVFGSFIGEVAASFDITDNTVDEFTGDGSTTTFTLSHELPSNNDALVTLDGVVQYPNSQSATRAYSTTDNTIIFTSAPADGVVIQVRHIGFPGATSQSVTGFYGRTGNVALKSTDDITFQNASAGIVTFTGDLKVGSGITISPDGDVFATGVVTATTFSGDGSGLTGVASTDNIRTNTNATFLQNVNVSGTTTATTFIGALTGTASLATQFTVSANNTNDQTTFPVFVDAATGSQGAETDTGLTYNPLTGNLTANKFTGDGSALTGIAATANVRTGILDVAGVSTFRNTMNVGAAVTISSSGIEASGSGITVANINGDTTGGKNLLINGAMNICQREDGSGSITVANGYYMDRWKLQSGGLDESCRQEKFTIGTTTDPYKEGFRQAYRIVNGNQTSGAGADDYIELYQYIEEDEVLSSNWDYKDSNSKLTISFWVKSSVSQTFPGFLYTTTGNGSSVGYMYDYVIGNGTSALTANVWTKVVHTLSGNSNLSVGNGVAIGLGFAIFPFQGSNYSTSRSASNAWASWTTSNKVPDMTTTWYTTNNATLAFTGFQLVAGSQATPYNHKHITEELMLCKRYFQKMAAYGDHYMFGLARAESNTARTGIVVPVPMRVAPTVTCNGHRTFRGDGGYNSASTDTPSIYAGSDWVPDSAVYTIDFPGHSLTHNKVYALMSQTTSTNALTLDAEF